MFIVPFAEVEGQGFVKEYWSILTDPAHFAVEVTITILLDVLLLGTIWPLVKTYVNAKLQRQHDQLDAEHGIHHHEDHVHIDRGAHVIPHEEHPDHD
jgi:ABC-type nickel/cobalt efflux system permease component RcnA